MGAGAGVVGGVFFCAKPQRFVFFRNAGFNAEGCLYFEEVFHQFVAFFDDESRFCGVCFAVGFV